ncbi:MAG: hypothetical protein VW708_09095, partial [Ilumatobacter sp.]
MEMSGNGGSATGDAAGTGVSTYALTDRYTEPATTAFLSGVQALARIPIEQVAADRAAGLSTAVFASGYPGSPLGGLGDAVDHAFGLLRGVDGLTSAGADNGDAATRTAIRAAQQAAWDTVLLWVPNEFFTGRSVDYAFRRGGDSVPGSAFMLIRDTVWALAEYPATTTATALTYTEPESGFSDYYAAAYDAANDHLVSLG